MQICSLRSYHPTSVYEYELDVKKGFYGVFKVPINAHFVRLCLDSDKCLNCFFSRLAPITYMNTVLPHVSPWSVAADRYSCYGATLNSLNHLCGSTNITLGKQQLVKWDADSQ